MGEEINEYAGADNTKWTATMTRVLAWDTATPNGFEPKNMCASAISQQRAGLQDLISHVREQGDEIRKTREKNGLPNGR